VRFGGWPLPTSGDAKGLSATLPRSLVGHVRTVGGPCWAKTGQWSS
jgi:hypothetical protein